MGKDWMGALAGKVVLLNAPPHAGKDTVADRIVELCGSAKGQFKDHLYVVTSVVFGVNHQWFLEIATDEELKEIPHQALGGVSPRQALITVSEDCIKPVFGKSYFGNIEAGKLGGRLENGVVYSDSGFVEEAAPLISLAGAENVFIIKFTRKGADSFEGDSRDWLPRIEGVSVMQTANNGTVDEIVNRIFEFVERGGQSIR